MTTQAQPGDEGILLSLEDLSGETNPVSLADFIRDNESEGVEPLDPSDVEALRRLQVGNFIFLGIGGGGIQVWRVG